jgi:hypothetical protein
VVFADTSVRWFESNEWVLTSSITNRLGGDRQELREVAEARGFERLPDDEKDKFHRGSFSVEVHYDGDSATYARRLRAGEQIGFPFADASARNTALDWLINTRPKQA